jgi:hypothetical protein
MPGSRRVVESRLLRQVESGQETNGKAERLFRLLYASGLMLGPTTAPTNDPPIYRTGSIATTGIARMVA